MQSWKEQAEAEGQHLEEKVDPAEALVAEQGIEGALDELTERLRNNPEDAEARRMATLILNRADAIAEAAATLKQHTQH